MKIVNTRSVSTKLQASLLAAVLPAIAVVHALGFDWGTSDSNEQLARDAAVAAVSSSLIIFVFAVIATLRKDTKAEPVALAGSIGGLISTVFALCFAFDWGSEALLTTLLAFVVAILTPVGISITRDQVYPQSNVIENPNVEPQDHF